MNQFSIAMNYTNWAEIQQNPNPNSDFSVLLHAPNHSLQNLPPDPYQQLHVPSHTAFFLPPQPRPPGVDLPYVPPPVPVTYAPPPQPVTYVHQPSFEAQQGADAAAAASAYYHPDPNVSWVAAIPQFGATPYAAGVSSTPNPVIQPQRRYTWKKAPKKTKVVQSAWCEVCKVDCNSKGVLDQHKLGRKHLKNLQKLVAATPTISAPIFAAPISAITVNPPTSIAVPPATIVMSTSLPVPTPAPAPAPIPASASASEPVIGPQENPVITKSKSQKSRKKAAARTEDLETKRRKVLEGGAAANSVRACNICNVVCNSDTVFNYHIAGQKHASMAKKHARAGVAASAM
ncbi:SH3 domain-containing protein C23A1.17 [Salvia miltiorrhiza]|uniref:SH3 domain-containing protein C23A1.17 n=1 Tax=Salvia miltiorrhiza TaxID=226208 RepID=UPI0025AC27C0|nr:SH3 domain-containing protein C23A1.17 [Salvia miltiorrhiza]